MMRATVDLRSGQEHEARMSGRRSHPRYIVGTPWVGSVRVLRDVVVARTGGDELLVLTQAAAVVGEDMTLELVAGGLVMALRVAVEESRPVVVDGSVRHRLRARILERLTREAALRRDAAAGSAGEPL
jgi:hypothetical protein